MSLVDIYKKYQGQVRFLMIYIREAHPVDGWWFGKGLARRLVRRYSKVTSLDTYDPQTITERRSVAQQCQEALQFGVRTYVDEMDDRVSKAYAAKPTRMYLIGKDSRVAYAGGLGPHGFKPAELEAAIEDYLAG